MTTYLATATVIRNQEKYMSTCKSTCMCLLKALHHNRL